MMNEELILTIINTGAIGIFFYLTITKIEAKLDKLIEEIHDLVKTFSMVRNN